MKCQKCGHSVSDHRRRSPGGAWCYACGKACDMKPADNESAEDVPGAEPSDPAETSGTGLRVAETAVPLGEFETIDGTFTIGVTSEIKVIVESDPGLGGWKVRCTKHGRLTTRSDHGRAKDYAREHVAERHDPANPDPANPDTFRAPELPTRAERDVTSRMDGLDEAIRDRSYSAAVKLASELLLKLHAMALLGREGVDAIPFEVDLQRVREGSITGLDSPAGAGADVEADRG